MSGYNAEQCGAYARSFQDGLDPATHPAEPGERVVVCTEAPHAPPEDDTAEHFDKDLGIVWRYPTDRDDYESELW